MALAGEGEGGQSAETTVAAGYEDSRHPEILESGVGQGVNTWHYGSVTLRWAESKVGGDDVEFFWDAIV